MSSKTKFETSIPNSSIEAWKKAGGKVVATVCCHVPEELIHAAGALPVRVRGTGITDDSEAEVWMSSWSCSYTRGCLQQFLNGNFKVVDALIATDGCSLAQRLQDNVEYIYKELPSLLLTVPRIHKAVNAVRFYKDDLVNMVAFLEKLTGNKITDNRIRASLAVYNETRRLIRELYAFRKADKPVISATETLRVILAAMSMPKEEFNGQLSIFLEELKTRAPLEGGFTRLMVVSSAMDDPAYLKIIEDKGALVVTDSQCYGSRYMWEPVELTGGDVLTDIAAGYTNRIVCPRMNDMHNEFYDRIRELYTEYKAQGILYVRMKNCDMWGGEAPFVEERFRSENLPWLHLEREEMMTNAGQLAVRVEAFIEMIEGGA